MNLEDYVKEMPKDIHVIWHSSEDALIQTYNEYMNDLRANVGKWIPVGGWLATKYPERDQSRWVRAINFLVTRTPNVVSARTVGNTWVPNGAEPPVATRSLALYGGMARRSRYSRKDKGVLDRLDMAEARRQQRNGDEMHIIMETQVPEFILFRYRGKMWGARPIDE